MREYQPTKDDIEVTQYLRPDGRKRTVYAPVGEEYAKKAENMILSAEELTTGMIVVYARWAGEPEENEYFELASNGPGPRSPTSVLKLCIEHKFKERNPMTTQTQLKGQYHGLRRKELIRYTPVMRCTACGRFCKCYYAGEEPGIKGLRPWRSNCCDAKIEDGASIVKGWPYGRTPNA